MIARTQIGGKYDQSELSLFDLKRKLEVANVKVSHPSSYGIVCTVDGRGYTFDPQVSSFFDIETDYYRSIAESDFHTVNNRFLGRMGYIGASAALEMTYAMLHNRPILLMHPIDFAPSVNPTCAEIINSRANLLQVHNIENMDTVAIAEVAAYVKSQGIDYNLGSKTGNWVLGQVEQVFTEIRYL